MGVIWDYFKEKLRFPLIQSPGPLAQMAKGGAEAADLTRDHEIWLRDQFLANQCDDQFLSDFGASRGIRRWPYEPEVLWRDRVIRAYVFYMLGGKAAGVAQIFDMAGVDADIIEPRDSHDAWTVRGGVRLDGTWQVNGSEKLIAPYRISYAGLLAWAEFMVSAAIDDAADEAWESLLRSIVAEFKPARSIPYYRFYASAEISQPHDSESEGYIRGESRVHGLHCGLRVDGTWGLGTLITLNGTWAIDGAMRLGQFIAEKQITNCRVFSDGYIHGAVDVIAGFLLPNFYRLGIGPAYFQVTDEDPEILDGALQVGYEDAKKLDGTWQIGKYAAGSVLWPFVKRSEGRIWIDLSLSQPVDIETEGAIRAQCLVNTGRCTNHLDGSWTLGPHITLSGGSPRPLDGSWTVGGGGEACRQITNCHVASEQNVYVDAEISMAVRRYFSLDTADPVALDGSHVLGYAEGDFWPQARGAIITPTVYYGGSADALPLDIILGGLADDLPTNVVMSETWQPTVYYGGSADALPLDVILGGLADDLPTNVVMSDLP
jgi:hypothetical protein